MSKIAMSQEEITRVAIEQHERLCQKLEHAREKRRMLKEINFPLPECAVPNSDEFFDECSKCALKGDYTMRSDVPDLDSDPYWFIPCTAQIDPEEINRLIKENHRSIYEKE